MTDLDTDLDADLDADLDVVVVATGRPASLVAVLAGLVAQTVQGFRLLLQGGAGEPADADPAVQGALRVLAHRGNRVSVCDDALAACTASRLLRLDDDVLLPPTALADLLAALEAGALPEVEAPVHGLLRGPVARCVLSSRAALPAEEGAVPSAS